MGLPFNCLEGVLQGLFSMLIMNGLRAAGEDKGMLARTPITDVGDTLNDRHLTGIPGFHKLDKIDLQIIPRRPHGQTNRTGGLSDPLSIVDVNETGGVFLD